MQNVKFDQKKVQEFLSKKWVNGCYQCNSKEWNISPIVFETREYKEGKTVFGNNEAIFPIIYVTCTNCSNTLQLNAFLCGGLEKPKDSQP